MVRARAAAGGLRRTRRPVVVLAEGRRSSLVRQPVRRLRIVRRGGRQWLVQWLVQQHSENVRGMRVEGLASPRLLIRDSSEASIA